MIFISDDARGPVYKMYAVANCNLNSNFVFELSMQMQR